MKWAQKAQSPGGAGQSADDSKTDPHIIGEPTDRSKRTATLLAQFALKGHVVHRLEGGGFLVCRWGLVRACRDLEALEGFARQMGVRE
jgi:hypothetical protein